MRRSAARHAELVSIAFTKLSTSAFLGTGSSNGH